MFKGGPFVVVLAKLVANIYLHSFSNLHFSSLLSASTHTQIRVLASLRHPNIVAMLAVYETPTHLLLVMDRAHGGELFDRIVARGHFTETDAITVFELKRRVVTYSSLGYVIPVQLYLLWPSALVPY